MEQYIPKSAVIAEIDRRISILQKNPHENHKTICHLDAVKQVLNTLEVKEVDLDGERRKYLTEHFNVYEDGILQSKRSNLPLDTYDVIKIAKHFFELGLNASNPLPLTWEDVRLLDLLCCKVDMSCDLEEKEHYGEVLKRFKALKGEKV